jgi:hypothetical protein
MYVPELDPASVPEDEPDEPEPEPEPAPEDPLDEPDVEPDADELPDELLVDPFDDPLDDASGAVAPEEPPVPPLEDDPVSKPDELEPHPPPPRGTATRATTAASASQPAIGVSMPLQWQRPAIAINESLGGAFSVEPGTTRRARAMRHFERQPLMPVGFVEVACASPVERSLR